MGRLDTTARGRGKLFISGVSQLFHHSIQNPGNIGDTEMRVAIYCRVSTDNQELTQQEAACRRFCDYREYKVAEVYQEIVSGAKSKRPEYQRLVANLRTLTYQGVVVFRLDRLGRNARELALLVDELENKGIKVLSVHENFDTSTALGRAMRELIYIFAQLEREQIGEATKQRLAALKAQGKKLGRKPASAAQIRRVRQLRANGLSLREIARNASISYGTVPNIINGNGTYSGKGCSSHIIVKQTSPPSPTPPPRP